VSLTFDPEIAAALAPMAESGFTPPAVGDIAGRRAIRCTQGGRDQVSAQRLLA
jgi:hypothetical protein